ncbi:aspartokinase 1, chloroplastic [Nicotiana attenuata]|uniref:Aspartokinase 1, chloroplastic n=1 Tax=Nicotiana attenuata TaxID=49451 RepID=A0A314KVK1_NICAT|nr:aspartokinase 1, chloroplastic [Nicotiana attenuata]
MQYDSFEIGRGGSDLTATTIGKALGLCEIQVLHPQSMRPSIECDIPVRVKNSYNPKAPGTLITRCRDMSKAVLTSIVLKRNVTMLDIVSTRMLGQFGFLAKVGLWVSLLVSPQISDSKAVLYHISLQLFSIFEDLGISVHVVVRILP